MRTKTSECRLMEIQPDEKIRHWKRHQFAKIRCNNIVGFCDLTEVIAKNISLQHVKNVCSVEHHFLSDLRKSNGLKKYHCKPIPSKNGFSLLGLFCLEYIRQAETSKHNQSTNSSGSFWLKRTILKISKSNA